MNKSMDKNPFSRLLVAIQTLAAATIVLSTHLSIDHIEGLGVSLVGLLLGIWAVFAIGVFRVSILPELKANAELVTSGPYRWVRHPMYAALLVFTGGLVFCPLEMWKCVTWLLLVAVLLAKISIEERHLKAQFPEYEAYAGRTKRIIPFVL